MEEVRKTEEEWEKVLTPEEFLILRKKGTEPAFTGKYYKSKDRGVYKCAACGNEIFSSDAKYDSGSGWPSFYKPKAENAVEMKEGLSHGMRRVEVMCKKCGSHLGHVFPDGPKPNEENREATGKRFCINSAALKLNKQDNEK